MEEAPTILTWHAAKWAIHFDADEHGVANASFNGMWSSLSPVLLTTSFLSY